MAESPITWLLRVISATILLVEVEPADQVIFAKWLARQVHDLCFRPTHPEIRTPHTVEPY